MARQVRPAMQHLRGRRPVRPFPLGADLGDAAPGEAVPAHPDGIAQRLVVAEHEIEPALRRADDDGAGFLAAGVTHHRACRRGTEQRGEKRAAAAANLLVIGIGGRRRDGDGDEHAGRGSALKGRKVAPKYKYRGPGGETWAGRGARPRWLAALIKQGRKLDEFAIDKALTARKGRMAKKTRRKKK